MLKHFNNCFSWLNQTNSKTTHHKTWHAQTQIAEHKPQPLGRNHLFTYLISSCDSPRPVPCTPCGQLPRLQHTPGSRECSTLPPHAPEKWLSFAVAPKCHWPHWLWGEWTLQMCVCVCVCVCVCCVCVCVFVYTSMYSRVGTCTRCNIFSYNIKNGGKLYWNVRTCMYKYNNIT